LAASKAEQAAREETLLLLSKLEEIERERGDLLALMSIRNEVYMYTYARTHTHEYISICISI